MSLSRKVWDGEIACVITLAPEDSNQMELKHDYFLVLSRNSYLTLSLPSILSYFEKFLLVPEWAQRSSWWFEYDGAPLLWSLPTGVLYDTLTQLDPENRASENVWHLTLHYRDYPNDYILPLTSSGTLEQHWVNQVKESCYVQNGSAKPIMSLSRQLSTNLWKSVFNHDYELFWSIFPRLIPTEFKYIPVRFHLTLSNRIIDVPLSPNKSSGEQLTLKEALQQVLPDIFDSDKQITAKPVLHGVTVPLDAPLVEIYKEMLYIDGFLHFSILII